MLRKLLLAFREETEWASQESMAPLHACCVILRSDLTSLCPWKMRIIIAPISQGYHEDQMK